MHPQQLKVEDVNAAQEKVAILIGNGVVIVGAKKRQKRQKRQSQCDVEGLKEDVK
jgi:hypothetical protein